MIPVGKQHQRFTDKMDRLYIVPFEFDYQNDPLSNKRLYKHCASLNSCIDENVYTLDNTLNGLLVHYKAVSQAIRLLFRTWPHETPLLQKGIGFRAIVYASGRYLNPSLAEHDKLCLSKQSRSRSVGF